MLFKFKMFKELEKMVWVIGDDFIQQNFVINGTESSGMLLF